MPKDENRIEHLLFMSGIEIPASRLLAVGAVRRLWLAFNRQTFIEKFSIKTLRESLIETLKKLIKRPPYRLVYKL